MNFKTTDEVGNTFLDFFQSKNHQLHASSSILPLSDDNSLLFINSGMARLKNMFTGQEKPPHHRLTNIQPCIRTVDIDSIGDARHGTSFRMMGNWSFGDYFKQEAIAFAFELITEVFQFPKDKLYVSVFHNDGSDSLLKSIPSDEESMKIWSQYLPSERIILCPPKDNFWQAGSFGPCGPCTEVFFDRGPEYGDAHSSEKLIDDRHIEIWNAGVFMQYFMNIDGSITDLPQQCVDAGAGLERFAMILQNAASIHEIDQHKVGYELALEIVKNERWARIIFDHMKTFILISREGIRPSNKDQGSVVRTLLRRVFTGLYMTGNSIDEALVLLNTIAFSVDQPEITNTALPYLNEFLKQEVESFKRLLNTSEKRLKKIGQSASLSAHDAFTLRSTHGVPIELIKEYCLVENISFDYSQYELLEKQHREVSKQ